MKKINKTFFGIYFLIFLFTGVKTGWSQDCIPRGTNEKACPFTINIGSSITELDGREKYTIGNDIDIETARQFFSIETSCPQSFYFAVFTETNGEEEWKLQTKGRVKGYFSGSLSFPIGRINTREFPKGTKVRVKISDTFTEIEMACSSLQSDSDSAQSRSSKFGTTMDCGLNCNPCPRGMQIIKPINTINEIFQQELQVIKEQKQLSKAAIYPNPIYGNANLAFTLAKKDFIEISLFDISGKQKKLMIQEYSKGKNVVNLNLVDLPAGFYTVLLKTAHTIKTLKVIKS